MVRVAGENTVPAGGIGTQPRRGAVAHCIDLDFRSGLLLCNLPSRYIPGCRFMAGGETEEKSFPVFPRLVLAKIRGDGDLYPCHDQRVRGMGGLDRTLQRLRAHRLQLIRTPLAMGEQLSGLLGGTGGQLCFLRDGSLATKPPDLYHCHSYLHYTDHTCLAEWANLLQHDLPSRNVFGIDLPFFRFQTGYRYVQMQWLRLVCP